MNANEQLRILKVGTCPSLTRASQITYHLGLQDDQVYLAIVKIYDASNDRFYIIPWDCLRDILVGLHETYLAKHNSIRPKKWDSLRCAIAESDLEPFRDKWDTIEKNLK